MKTTVQLKQTAVLGSVWRDELSCVHNSRRPCILVIDGVEFESHPRVGQSDIKINEIARRLCEEISKT